MMLRALAESRERQARLVTDAGHELRTPLTSLRTNVELLMASMAPGAPRLPESEMAGAACRRARRRSRNCQRWSAIWWISPATTPAMWCTSRSIWRSHRPKSRASPSAPQRYRIRRRTSCPGRSTAMRRDCRGRCSICSTTPRSGARPGGQVNVRLAQVDPSHAELVVADHGPGIPPQERQLVFERFYRSASARAMPGSGLGLAIVKHVVMKHGGVLRIEDTVPGGQPPGTSIHVLLPGRPMPTAADNRPTTRWRQKLTSHNSGELCRIEGSISVDSQSSRQGRVQ